MACEKTLENLLLLHNKLISLTDEEGKHLCLGKLLLSEHAAVPADFVGTSFWEN